MRDRIIVHLAGYIRYAQEFECPEEMSQSGIAEAIGKSRAHTTLELNRMKDIDLITERLAHVKNARSKRKTYNLTAEALTRERQIAGHIDGMEIEINDSGIIDLMNGHQATETIIEKLSVSRLIAFDMLLGSNGKFILDDMKNQNNSLIFLVSVLLLFPKIITVISGENSDIT